VTLVCLPQEAELINAKGAIVRMPVKGREGLVEVNSRAPRQALRRRHRRTWTRRHSTSSRSRCRSRSTARRACASCSTRGANRRAVHVDHEHAAAALPRAHSGIDPAKCESSYTDPSVWKSFDAKLMTLCSPDPQAFRPPDDEANVLQVRLPTNFKAARFDSDAHTALLAHGSSATSSSRASR
jgi:hypothetical protein